MMLDVKFPLKNNSGPNSSSYSHRPINFVPNSQKKDKNAINQGIRVQNMLQQVNVMLSHLLKDLQFLYVANGINYNIDHFHNTLVRLLTPFELLSHFQVADNSDLFTDKGPLNRNEGNSKTNTSYSSNINKKQNLCFTPTGYQYPQKRQNQQKNNQKSTRGKIKRSSSRYFYRRQRTKPILTPQIQLTLVQWALKKLHQNKRVRRKDLANKALKLSGNQQGFYGSIGWVNRFLNRHQKLRDQLLKRARANIGVRNVYTDFSEEEEDQIERLEAMEGKYQEKVEEEQHKSVNVKQQVQNRSNQEQFNYYLQSNSDEQYYSQSDNQYSNSNKDHKNNLTEPQNVNNNKKQSQKSQNMNKQSQQIGLKTYPANSVKSPQYPTYQTHPKHPSRLKKT